MLKAIAKRVLPARWYGLVRRLRQRPGAPSFVLPPGVRLNVGCGTDYREDFVNIDGSPDLPKVDRVIDLDSERLTDHFQLRSVAFILANDVVEHHFHWQAVELLRQFYVLLIPGGRVEIRVPDCRAIIDSRHLSLEEKLVLLYGGQDVPRGLDPEMDESRRSNPRFFCHKFGWTMERMRYELEQIGYNHIHMQRAGTNFLTFAAK